MIRTLRCQLLSVSALAGLGLLAGCAAAAVPTVEVGSARADRKPNIVFILADDLGWRDVSFMGSTFYETPHIDRLASQGMAFTAAYSNGPNCAPTRASLMTGQYTPRHGIYTVGGSARGDPRYRKLIPIPNRVTLPTEVVTLAEALRPMGYVKAQIGKWHLGESPGHTPRAQGFDVSVSKGQEHPDTEGLTEAALRFIEAERDRPFFLYLPYHAVHTPLRAKPELVEKYRRKRGSGGQDNAVFAAMIETMDEGVGRVLAKLDELGLAENTLVIFSSDNGWLSGSTSNAPLRGSKGMLYEGGIRVPLVVRWPGVVRPRSRTEVPVISSDFYPTLLEVAGALRPEGQVLDGVSLLPLLRGGSALGREDLFWHFPAYLQGNTPEEGHWRTTPAGAMRSGDWKLLEFFEDGRQELYNLRDDIGEARNLAGRIPEKARELHGRMVAWRQAIGAPVPDQRNPAYQAEPAAATTRAK